MIARAALLVGGVLLLAPAASSGQTRFEIAAGAHYGMNQRPMTPGWVVSGGFQIDQQDFVVEAAWAQQVRTRELRFSLGPFDEDVGSETSRNRYLMLAAGVRSGQAQSQRFSPFYQVLLGGMTTRFRTDYEWPALIDTEAENANCGGFVGDRLLNPCFNLRYPEYEEQRTHWFLMQPGVGLDVLVQQRLKVRLTTDLLVIANRDRGMHVVPRLSVRVAVGF